MRSSPSHQCWISLWFVHFLSVLVVPAHAGNLFFDFVYEPSFDTNAGSNAAAGRSDFEYVGAYLSSTLRSSVPWDVTLTMRVSGTVDTAATYLGRGGASQFFGDSGTFLKASSQLLAQAGVNRIAGGGPVAGVLMNFKPSASYGYGGVVANNQIDFRSVALHELVHGLGFQGFITATGSSQSGSYSDFDRFLWGWDGTQYRRLISNSLTPLTNSADAVVNSTNRVLFFGPNVSVFTNGSGTPMYTPSVFAPGSSLYHVDEGTDPLYYQASFGPEEIALTGLNKAILQDLGYSVATHQIAWSGTGSTNAWSDSTNWIDGVRPMANDNFSLGSGVAPSSTVDLDVSGTASSLTIEAANSFSVSSLTGKTLTLTGGVVARMPSASGTQVLAAGIAVASGTALWDVNGTGRLVVSGGISGTGISRALLKTGSATLELGGTSSFPNGTTVRAGTLEVSGGSLQHTTSNFVVGDQTGDVGTLAISGGRVSSLDARIGLSAGSAGSAVVSSGTWSQVADLIVGFSGLGTVSMTGGSVSTGSTAYLGYSVGSSGGVSVAGGNLTSTNHMYVGLSGSGSLAVSGGRVTNLDGRLGWNAGSTGIATVSSGTWGLNGDLVVGYSGVGTVSVTGGSISTGSTAFFGYLAGGFGGASVSGGSLVSTGDMYVGRSGSGALTIAGGRVQSASVWAGTNPTGFGAVAVQSGTLSPSGALLIGYSGGGSVTMSGGAITPGSAAYFGYNAGSSGSATISGGTFAGSADLILGFSGTGSMRISGGSVTAVNTFLGNNAGSVGSMIVSGGTFSSTTNNTAVGFSGRGSLTVDAAGTFVVAAGTGQLFVAYSAGSSGTLSLGAGGSPGVVNAASIAGGSGSAAVVFNHASSGYAFTPRLTGAMSVSHVGVGTTILSSNNSFSGPIAVTAGTLQFAKTVAMYQGGTASWTAANLTTGSGATMAVNVGGVGEFASSNLDLLKGLGTGSSGFAAGSFLGLDTSNAPGGMFTYSSSISNPNGGINRFGVAKLGAGTLVLSGSNTFTGGIRANGGTLRAGVANAFGTGTVTLASGTLDLSNLIITNPISNTGGVVVNAAAYAGTQQVSGSVSFTGTVGGTVNVSASGELKGSGVVFNGPVTLASGAQHSPGNSPGIQTFNSGLSYSTGSILNWELIANSGTGAGTNYDFLSVTGGSLSVASGALLNLIFSGSGSAVSWSDPFWNADRSWTIIDALAATSSTGDFTLGTISNDSLGRSLNSIREYAGFALDQSGNNVVLTFTAVPEPSSYVLALMGLGISGWAMRRRKSHRARRAA